MTKEQIAKALVVADIALGNEAHYPERNMNATTRLDRCCHLLWMIAQSYIFLDEARLDKAQRWLGFIQGALWSLGLQDIETAKRANMPDGAQFDKDSV